MGYEVLLTLISSWQGGVAADDGLYDVEFEDYEEEDDEDHSLADDGSHSMSSTVQGQCFAGRYHYIKYYKKDWKNINYFAHSLYNLPAFYLISNSYITNMNEATEASAKQGMKCSHKFLINLI